MPTLRSQRFPLTISASALAAGATKFWNFATDDVKASEIPFNNIVIKNFSGQRLFVEYGDTQVYLAGYEIYEDDAAYGTTSLKISNVDTVSNDDMIYVIVSREVTADAAILANLTGQNLYQISNGDA